MAEIDRNRQKKALFFALKVLVVVVVIAIGIHYYQSEKSKESKYERFKTRVVSLSTYKSAYIVQSLETRVQLHPGVGSQTIILLKRDTEVIGVDKSGSWINISCPAVGWILEFDLSKIDKNAEQAEAYCRSNKNEIIKANRKPAEEAANVVLPYRKEKIGPHYYRIIRPDYGSAARAAPVSKFDKFMAKLKSGPGVITAFREGVTLWVQVPGSADFQARGQEFADMICAWYTREVGGHACVRVFYGNRRTIGSECN